MESYFVPMFLLFIMVSGILMYKATGNIYFGMLTVTVLALIPIAVEAIIRAIENKQKFTEEDEEKLMRD